MSKDVYANVSNSLIHQTLKLEMTHLSINRTDKQLVAYPHNGTLLNAAQDELLMCATIIPLQEHYAEWKTPDAEEYVL